MEDNRSEIIVRASGKQPKALRASNRAFTIATVVVTLLVGIVIGSNLGSIYKKIAPNSSVSDIDLSSVQDLYREIKSNYNGEVDDAALADGAKKGLVTALGDPYSGYLTTSEQSGLVDNINGDFSGIGAELGLRNGVVEVLRLLQNSPAQKSGLQVGDVVYTVGGEDVSSLGVSEVASKIRGEVGTPCNLVVLRGGELKTFAITRAKITDTSVWTEVKKQDGKNILVLHIVSFSEDAGDKAYSLVRQEMSKAKIDGVVLDLRGDGGGYVQAAQSLLSLWLGNKIIMTEKHLGGESSLRSFAGKDILADTPTVVLINGSSASASEITAGALRDYDKAILVGEQSYGKGCMQQMLGLADGNYLKITIADWYTPNGNNVNEVGLTPDEVVGLTVEDLNNNRDPQLSAALNKLTK
ncbi:MAG: S41 family peptidase [Candidatus Nomurabacteria bacterium]|jgi:carboxyl-terminal processing protease|nr:S41 family peptidase [Candidatus Nomurabacteria bacterium]